MCLTPALVQQLFPKVEFAFFGNYVNRYRRQLLKNQTPAIDLILAVKDSKEFHEENLVMNKHHYTYFVRSTRGKVVHKIQQMGARMHFNHMEIDNGYVKEISNGDQSNIMLRYGVINMDDMLRDLQYWETLLTSSFMQRPHEVLEKGSSFD